MRNLEKLLKSILEDEYGMLEKLSKELMKTMINWLSNNLDFWKAAEHGSGHCSCFEQVIFSPDYSLSCYYQILNRDLIKLCCTI